MGKKMYKFPDDYLPYLGEDGLIHIKARPDVALEPQYFEAPGKPSPESVPEQYHFINLFLEDVVKRRINSVKAARKLLADLIKASIMDHKHKFKGIYIALTAIKIFIQTEDFHKYGEELKRLQKQMDSVRNFLDNQDLGIARAEKMREKIKISGSYGTDNTGTN